eukprot:SM000247S08302  [mRNA]  locus=s247:130667:131819:- [translate_table: standard]
MGGANHGAGPATLRTPRATQSVLIGGEAHWGTPGRPVTNNSRTNVAKYGEDTIDVAWQLNSSFAGTGADAGYKQILIKLCYGAPSRINRAWRKFNDDLSKSKACKWTLKRQPYSAAGNSSVYVIPKNQPKAEYFVRVFALNSTSKLATQAQYAVAFGQNTDKNQTANLLWVVPYTGRHASLDIAMGVISAFSIIALTSYLVLERVLTKNK